MAKKGNIPWNKGKHIVQFCPKGHDTFIVGRNKHNGNCNQCYKEKHPRTLGHPKKQFCPRGHDTFICGRTSSNGCKLCIEEKRLAHKKPKSTLCKRGHDKCIVGTYPNGQCKECRKILYREKHPKRFYPKKKFCVRGHVIALVGRTKVGNCKGCLKDKHKNLSDAKKKEMAEKRREYDKTRTEKRKKYQQEYYEKNKVVILKKCQDYRQRHKKERSLSDKERRKNDINFKLTCDLRTRLRQAIKGNQKKGSAVRDLGCTIEFLKKYIEKQFYDGMTWNNWGTVWELDHIVPLWKFDLTNRKRFLKAVNYKNLQPLTMVDHKKKSKREFKEWVAKFK